MTFYFMALLARQLFGSGRSGTKRIGSQGTNVPPVTKLTDPRQRRIPITPEVRRRPLDPNLKVKVGPVIPPSIKKRTQPYQPIRKWGRT